MNILRLLFCVLAFLLALPHTHAARILVAAVSPMKSHFMMNKALVSELLSRGHAVTFITNTSMGKQVNGNYTEVLIQPVYDFWADVQAHFQTETLLELSTLSLLDFLKMLEIIGERTTEHALKQPKIREIFNRKDTQNVYDLLIAQQFYQEAFLALGQIYDVPVITYSTLGYENYMSQMMGVVTPWSFVPHGFLPLDDKMTFRERLWNAFGSLYEDFYREFIYFPKQDALVKKHLSHLPIKIPRVSKMEKNISLMLLNSHVPLTTPRPTMPGMISIGGVHIYPVKPLPENLQKFLDEATHGAIYFSLGTNVPSSDMSAEKLSIFLEVFASLKQRVLWKFEDENVPNLPQNVMVKKWIPQNDVLAHPNMKVFITHGGLFSSQEAVYHGVPMLGIPFFNDQYLNTNKAARAGYALTLQFPSVTRESLKHSLTELIQNPSYKKNVQRISAIFRDRPENPRDTAVYWVEYVIRHRGALHLRSAGLDLAWYEFYLLDVVGATLLAIAFLAVVLFRLIKGFTAAGDPRTKQKSN